MTENILQKVRDFYESAKNASAYQNWQKEATQAWQFYDGKQWSEEETTKLQENGQAPIVINKIASKVDNIAGTEIAGRTRILYRSRSGDTGEEKSAKALSDLALFVAERNDQALEISNMFKEGLVTGIGWLDTGVEKEVEGESLFNRHEDAFRVVWDVNSKRMDYSDARFVCRERWLDTDDLQQLFPTTHGKLIEQMTTQSHSVIDSLYSTTGEKEISYFNTQKELYRIVEVQYKKTEKRYKVISPLGKTFTTFEKEVAYADSANTVESDFYPRVYLSYFSDNLLLEHRPLPYQHNSFTLIPYIFKRCKEDGRPYGLVQAAIDPQRELNKRRSKAMHLLNTAQVIADIDAVEDINLLAREAARPDGIILKRPGKELRIIRNTDLAASQVNVMEQASKDIQEVLGVFDETIGKKSNATSGIAIQQRQMAGSLNQMFAFDALRRSKKQLGMVMLSLIRQFFTAEMVIQITDNFMAPRIVRLNEPVLDGNGETLLDDTGEIVLQNDVRTGVFDVLIEEVKDVLSSREFELSQLNMLMQSGVPVPPKLLVQATSLQNKEELMESLTIVREEPQNTSINKEI